MLLKSRAKTEKNIYNKKIYLSDLKEMLNKIGGEKKKNENKK
jgi:hypothetical protein